MKLDQFGQPFQLRLSRDGETEVRSLLGSFLSIIMLLVLITYGLYKIIFMIDKQGVTMS